MSELYGAAIIQVIDDGDDQADWQAIEEMDIKYPAGGQSSLALITLLGGRFEFVCTIECTESNYGLMVGYQSTAPKEFRGRICQLVITSAPRRRIKHDGVWYQFGAKFIPCA